MFAAWGRIYESCPAWGCESPSSSFSGGFLLQAWIQVVILHSRLLPADRTGWVHVQCHTGQTEVPDTPQRMISLFRLRACVFPSPRVEDKRLCPECVQSNTKIMRNFTRERSCVGNYHMLPRMCCRRQCQVLFWSEGSWRKQRESFCVPYNGQKNKQKPTTTTTTNNKKPGLQKSFLLSLPGLWSLQTVQHPTI